MPYNSKKKKKSRKKSTCHYGPTNTYVISSPLGEILLTCCQFGLHGLKFKAKNFTDFPNYKIPITVLKQMWCDNGYVYKPSLITLEWLKAYFSCPQLIPNITQPPICKIMEFKKDSFQEKIFKALEKVPFGNLITYSQLIEMIDMFVPESSLRSAIENHPIDIVIPYHRIVDYLHHPWPYSDISKHLLFHETLHQQQYYNL